MVHNFVNSNSVGSIGEALFLSFMKSLNKEVEDVSKDKEWRKRGVDFIVDGVRYDTKFDSKAESTGNMAVETVSRRVQGSEENRLGWVYTSDADYIVYITKFGLEWKWFFYSPEDLASLAETFEDNKKSVYNKTYSSEVVLVPLSELDEDRVLTFPVLGTLPKREVSRFNKLHEGVENARIR